jgi:predicted CoA-binding protein
LTAPEMSALLDAKVREIIRLRRQVAWFQRQIFGQKNRKASRARWARRSRSFP